MIAFEFSSAFKPAPGPAAIRTASELLRSVRVIEPWLTTLLAESIDTANVPTVGATEPADAIVRSPVLEVETAVLVAVEIVVAA